MKMKNKALNTQLDAELSRIEWTQHDRHAVLNRITEGSVQPVMKKKMTRSLALALVLAILTTGALAAGLIFSPRADAGTAADRALEARYGITAEMQTWFSRDVAKQPDGSYVVTYTGVPGLDQVLGTYTVYVNGSNIDAVWSHYGADTAGGLTAAAWGVDQLTEMMAIKKENSNDANARIREAACAAGQSMSKPMVTPDPIAIATEEAFDVEQQALAKQSKLSTAEMQELACMAIRERWQLTDSQIAALEYNPDLSWFHKDDGVLCYDVTFMLVQMAPVDDNTVADYTTMDGQYTVIINTDTGVIDDVIYESALGGNG